MTASGRFTVGIVVLFAAVWFVLCVWTIQTRSALLFDGDAAGYHGGAVSILEQGRYWFPDRPYTEREPGQSIWLALIYLVAGVGNLPAIFFAQAVLYLVAVFVLLRELRFVLSERAVRIAWVLLLFTPSIVHALFSLNREATTFSFFLLLAAGFLRLMRRPSWGVACGAGLALGALVLTYIPYILFPFLLLPLFLWVRIPSRYLLGLFMPLLIFLSIWGARNFAIEGKPCILGCYRSGVQWAVRGLQVEHLSGLEPFRCMWAEYVTRDWTGRSPYCHFNKLQHELWPHGLNLDQRDIELGNEGKARIRAHFLNYLWISVTDIVELHLPYVNGWGFWYNVSAAVGSLVLYVGCLLSIPALWRRREFLFFLMAMGYSIGLFVLTDATPRYLMPVLFCYAIFAAIGYDRALSTRKPS